MMSLVINVGIEVNTLRPRQNGRHFPDDIFKYIFLNENARISLRASLKFVPKVRINNIPALGQIMAWRRPGDKPLSEPMMVTLLTHICVARPQWVNPCHVTVNGNPEGDNEIATKKPWNILPVLKQHRRKWAQVIINNILFRYKNYAFCNCMQAEMIATIFAYPYLMWRPEIMYSCTIHVNGCRPQDRKKTCQLICIRQGSSEQRRRYRVAVVAAYNTIQLLPIRLKERPWLNVRWSAFWVMEMALNLVASHPDRYGNFFGLNWHIPCDCQFTYLSVDVCLYLYMYLFIDLSICLYLIQIIYINNIYDTCVILSFQLFVCINAFMLLWYFCKHSYR